jgi:hypothetical protein
VWLALGASALVGLLYSFGAVYLSEMESFGPRTPHSVWRQFAPDFFGGAALLLGLPLGRRVWEHSRAGGRAGRIGFWLALAGFASVVAGMLAAYRVFLPDDLAAFRPALGPWIGVALALGAQAYVAGAALIGFSARQEQTRRAQAAFALAAALLFAAPWMHQLPRMAATRLLPVIAPAAEGLLRLGPLANSLLGIVAAWVVLAAWVGGQDEKAGARVEGWGVKG